MILVFAVGCSRDGRVVTLDQDRILQIAESAIQSRTNVTYSIDELELNSIVTFSCTRPERDSITVVYTVPSTKQQDDADASRVSIIGVRVGLDMFGNVRTVIQKRATFASALMQKYEKIRFGKPEMPTTKSTLSSEAAASAAPSER